MTEEQPKQELADFSWEEIEEATAFVQARHRGKVTYSGAVIESYPLQLGNQKSIQLLEKKTSDQIPMVMVEGNLYQSVSKISGIECLAIKMRCRIYEKNN